MVGDIKYSQIEVTVAPQTSDDELASLPSTLKGAGVSVPSDVVVTDLSIAQESAHLTPHDCDDNKNNDTPFPSGYFVKADYGDTFAIGTSGYRVYDNGVGEERMLMANHVMTADCSAGDGKDLFDHNGNVIGTGTSKYHKGVDWILIDPQVSLSNSNYPDGAIWADGMDSHSGKFAVDGWVTKYGSKVIRDQDKVVENYGSTTGYDSGYIDAINVSKGNGCVNLFENGVKVSCDSGSGDSGGPVWFDDPTDGKVYIIGHISLGKKDKTITCDGEDIKYGNISVFYPFFRIKDSNPAFVLGDDQYG